jgi:RNA polymerase sigma-70 factor (ECF subfamily)
MGWHWVAIGRVDWPGEIPAGCYAPRTEEAPLADGREDSREAESDAELFARIRMGDAGAFAEFYDRHSGLLFGVALKVLGNESESEEVFQDACVAIWERAPLHDPAGGQPLGWAVTLVRNRAIDRLRSVRRKAELIEAASVETAIREAESADAAMQTMGAEAAGAVHGALRSLSAEQRQAVELAFFRGLTQQEIAAQLGQPLGTIKARIRRGMLALRDELEGLL